MDPQLQEIGMYEAANLLNILNSQENVSSDMLSRLSYDQGLTRYWRLVHFLDMMCNPRNFIPPYDGKLRI